MMLVFSEHLYTLFLFLFFVSGKECEIGGLMSYVSLANWLYCLQAWEIGIATCTHDFVGMERITRMRTWRSFFFLYSV